MAKMDIFGGGCNPRPIFGNSESWWRRQIQNMMLDDYFARVREMARKGII